MATDPKMTDVRETMRGRAKDLSLVELWAIIADLETTQPRKNAKPHMWKWDDFYPLALQAGKTVPIEESERRTLLFTNPTYYPKPYMTATLYAGCSLYNPGEVAPVHRHSPNASRFVIQGDGGFTTVEGEKCTMSRGDLIITPQGTWHDHGNDGREPVLWIDLLDLPLVETLSSSRFEFDYYEEEPDGSNSGERVKRHFQTVRAPSDHSHNLYAAGGLKPAFGQQRRGAGIGTPMFVYRWNETVAALDRMRGYDGSPHDGVILEYVNPETGESVVPTMAYHVQLLRPGEETQEHRHTASTAYFVIEGEGTTEVDGEEFAWGRNDVFAVPGWAWHRHQNRSAKKDAILYAVTDAPVLRKLALYREEARRNGQVEVVAG
ncbi:MAG: cupin domain-containing protein [Vicinamibacterales bacterium]